MEREELCPSPESFGSWCLSGICGTGLSRIFPSSPNRFSSEGQQLPPVDCLPSTRLAGLARTSPAPSLHGLPLKDVNTYIFSDAALVCERGGGSGAARTNFLFSLFVNRLYMNFTIQRMFDRLVRQDIFGGF